MSIEDDGEERRAQYRIRRPVLFLCLFAELIGMASCGSKANPSPTTPSVLQVAGTWKGTSTISSVSDSACPGGAIFVGSSFPMQIDLTQAGDQIAWTTPTCSWSGNVTSDGFTMTLKGGSCTDRHDVICGNSVAVTTQTVALTMTFKVNGNTATGTRTTSENVYVFGTSTVIGTDVLTESITVSR